MLKIAALNEELSQESSASDEFSNIPSKESEVNQFLQIKKNFQCELAIHPVF